VPAERFEEVPARALAVYAHPDDADVACAGTLARWADAGSEVHLVVCASGEKGAADRRLKPATIARRRAAEVDAAAAVIGIAEVHKLHHRDGEFENDVRLRGELVALLRSVRAVALVCPDPTAVFFGEHYYNHRDHRIVGYAALDAASPAAGSPLYFPSAGDPHSVEFALLTGSLAPNLIVEISSTIGRKSEAVMCHKSQLGEEPETFRTVIEERAAEAGRSAGVDFAEAFRRVWLRS
jgi:LmbE family N-acetylglucosaminyl deacetylase